jgi:hypothetical protein
MRKRDDRFRDREIQLAETVSIFNSKLVSAAAACATLLGLFAAQAAALF